MSGPLQKFGPSLIDSGFPIIPIHAGRKNPIGKDWQNHPLEKADLPKYNGAGIGLLSGVGNIPITVIDIDCAWLPGLKEAERLAFSILGFAPQRIGEPPKQALIYRAEESWSKQFSSSFQHESCMTRMSRDAIGEELRRKDQILRIEVLGKGQQAVIYGKHPVTEKPFRWIDLFGGLAFMNCHDLTLITSEQVSEFISEWDSWMKTQPGVSVYSQHRKQEILAPLPVPKANIPFDKIPEILAHHDPWPRQAWIDIGMRLHHEFDGDLDAFEAWVEWSRRWPEWIEDVNYQECEYQWNSFRQNKERIVTARTLVKDLNRNEEEDKLNEFIEKIKESRSVIDLTRNVIQKYRHLVSDNIAIQNFAIDAIQEQIKSFPRTTKISRSDISLILKRKCEAKSDEIVIVSEVSVENSDEYINWDYANRTPSPLRNWAWSAQGDAFINTVTGMEYKQDGFNGMFSQAAQAAGFKSASVWVHSLRNIPHADQTIYWPGAAKLLIRNDIRYVNTWSDRDYAKVPDDLSRPIDELGAGLIQKHISLICGGWNREAHLLTNFLKVCIFKPGTKIRWAPLIVGDPGDGKTFFMDFLRCAIGFSNVRIVDNSAMKAAAEKGFNAFAGCAQVACLNEVKMHGHNRYDIFNAMKPLVTDSPISITKKGKDQENVLNFTNWMLFSNYRDCMPIDSVDRRYFVIWSVFPLQTINATDSTYFSKLFTAMNEGGIGGMMRWIYDVEWHEDFKVNDPAPITAARAKMIRMNQDDLIDIVKTLVNASKSWAVQRDLLLFNYLKEMLASEGYPCNDFELHRALGQLSWLKIGFINVDGLVKGAVWSTIDMHKSESEKTLLSRYQAQLKVANYEF